LIDVTAAPGPLKVVSRYCGWIFVKFLKVVRLVLLNSQLSFLGYSVPNRGFARRIGAYSGPSATADRGILDTDWLSK